MALDAILSHKRTEIAERMSRQSLDGLLAQAGRSMRRFGGALRAGAPGYVLEIKYASPSAGTIRAASDLEPVLVSYGRHADAVSVLTDARFFGGSLERLAEARRRLDQPLLCKDFFLTPFQVAEARVHGADAVLLILAALDDATWRACAALAERLGMDVLTEVHDEAEAARAVALGAPIVGINNRNLRTLEVDLATTGRIAPLIPPDRLVIAESGIADRATAAALGPHADAFLVGSALMKSPDLDGAVRRLMYGRTKVCGLTDPDHAREALTAGATHGGLMFAEASPRRVSIEQAARVRNGAGLEWVGVFADQPAGDIADRAIALDLAAVQLHGKESEDAVARVRELVPSRMEVWRAVRVKDAVPCTRPEGADRLLLDAWSEERLGGTGASFDWDLLRGHPLTPDLILAGGLHAGNVARAASLGTWALDASSGLETSPGMKDPQRLRAFFRERRRMPCRGARGS